MKHCVFENIFDGCGPEKRQAGRYPAPAHLQAVGHLSANARMLGTSQGDAMQNITGSVGLNMNQADPSGAFYLAPGPSGSQTGVNGATSVQFDASRVARTSVENRGQNTAFHPIINI